jgi:quinol monooxygenase YgiN
MVHVIASIRIKPGCVARFIELFKANVPQVRAENGCIDYFPAIDIDAELPRQVIEENVVTIIERWQDLEALRAHGRTPHMSAYREQVRDLVEGSSLKVLREA